MVRGIDAERMRKAGEDSASSLSPTASREDVNGDEKA